MQTYNEKLQVIINHLRAAADDLETLNNKPMAIEELSFRICLYYLNNLVSTAVGGPDLVKHYREIYTYPKYEVRVHPDNTRSAEYLKNESKKKQPTCFTLRVQLTDNSAASYVRISRARMEEIMQRYSGTQYESFGIQAHYD